MPYSFEHLVGRSVQWLGALVASLAGTPSLAAGKGLTAKGGLHQCRGVTPSGSPFFQRSLRIGEVPSACAIECNVQKCSKMQEVVAAQH
jgi:hypothetical protein